MRKPRLMTPGPSPVPEDVLLELARPVIHHRSAEASAVVAEVVDGLKYVFQTQNDVLILTASGTGAMEAAVVNTVPAGGEGDRARRRLLRRRAGRCSARRSASSRLVDTEWGQPVDPAQVANALKDHPDAVAVFGTLSETSTGTGHPVEAIGQIVAETPALFVVDGISGVGAMECRTDDWGIDLLCVGSQKALMLPPGLAFVAVSPKAWAKIDAFDSPSYYFNLKAARKAMKEFDTPFTPAHTLIGALRTALKRIKAEGIENVWQRHRRMSEACQAGIQALGLELFSSRPAEGLTAFRVPEGLKDADIRNKLFERFGITTVGGQDKLKGQDHPGRPHGLHRRARRHRRPGGAGDGPERPGLRRRARLGRDRRAAGLDRRGGPSRSDVVGSSSSLRAMSHPDSCSPSRSYVRICIVAHRVLVTDKLAEEGLDLLRAEPGLEVVVNTKLAGDVRALRAALAEADGIVIRSGTQLTAEVLKRPAAAQGDRPRRRGGRQHRRADRDPPGDRRDEHPGRQHRLDRRAHDGPDAGPLAERRPGQRQPQGRPLGPEQVHRHAARGQDAGHRRPGPRRPGGRQAGAGVRHEGGRLRPVPLARAGAAELGIESVAKLDDLWGRCDYITLHTPLSAETRNLIGAAELREDEARRPHRSTAPEAA